MHPAKRARGFTLIEIMVVVAIIAVMAGAVVINMDFRNVGRMIRDTTLRTHLLMNLAADQAVYSRQQLGIRFHPESYEFYILGEPTPATETADAKPAVWSMLEDERLKFKEVPAKIEFQVQITGLDIVLEELEDELAQATEEEPIKPHVIFLSNGEIMPDFRIVISDQDGEYSHAIATGEDEPIITERLE